MYCVFSVVLVDKHGEIIAELALQGYASLHGEVNTFLITAAKGLWGGASGSVDADPLNDPVSHFLYKLPLLDEAL